MTGELSTAWVLGLVAVKIYCVVQAVRDFRAKRYVWAAAAALSAIVLLSAPIPKTITIDLSSP